MNISIKSGEHRRKIIMKTSAFIIFFLTLLHISLLHSVWKDYFIIFKSSFATQSVPLIIRWVALQQVHSFWDLSVRKSCLLSRSGSVKTHRTTNYLDIQTCSSASAEFITTDAPSASAVIYNFHLLHQNFFSILFFWGGKNLLCEVRFLKGDI